MAVTNKPPVTGAGPLNGILTWFDQRFPLMVLWKSQLSEYYAPKNFNVWYFFGSLALLVLVIQIVSGIFLTMNYKPSAEHAFASVEYIMRDVPGGWIIRYIHSTGASAFFIVVYLHMARGLMYGSYRKPRELTWIFGVLIYLCLMAEAFFGYLLPWGQMSFWGAQVIINLFATIPVIGEDLSVWIRGDYNVSDATLNRFFALHVIAIPLALLGLVAAHLMALHETGSNNPDGIEIHENLDPKTGTPVDGIPFHPYYTVKDIVGVAVFLIVFCAVVFFSPEVGGLLPRYNFIPADPLTARAHRAGVVLHALLRDAEGDTVLLQHAGLGRDRDGRGRDDLLRAAVARPGPHQVDPLSQADLPGLLRRLRRELPHHWSYLGVEPTNIWGEFPAPAAESAATTSPRLGRARAHGRLLHFFLLMPGTHGTRKTGAQRLT